MRVHHLNCGTMCPPFGRLIRGEGSLVSRGHMVCHCLLLETDAGLVLVDTGIGLGDMAEPRERLGPGFTALVGPRLDPTETAVYQVEALGFASTDVRHIVLTHLDLDHAGGLGDFPHAEVHVYRPEHDAAMTRSSLRERERYRPAQWAHGPRWRLRHGRRALVRLRLRAPARRPLPRHPPRPRHRPHAWPRRDRRAHLAPPRHRARPAPRGANAAQAGSSTRATPTSTAARWTPTAAPAPWAWRSSSACSRSTTTRASPTRSASASSRASTPARCASSPPTTTSSSIAAAAPAPAFAARRKRDRRDRRPVRFPGRAAGRALVTFLALAAHGPSKRPNASHGSPSIPPREIECNQEGSRRVRREQSWEIER